MDLIQYTFFMTNLYGPGEHFHPERSHGLAALMKKVYDAKKEGKKEIEIWGTGRPIREWLYVRDAAEAVLRAGASYDSVQPLNIGTGKGYTITELVKTMMNVLDYQAELKYLTDMPDGAMKKVFGIKKMKEELGWLPSTPIEEGIKETVEWLDENYDYAISR